MTEYIYQENIEVWRDIEGYEGLYQVSDKGNVKSLERTRLNNGGSVVKVKERILKPGVESGGYLLVVLCKDSKRKPQRIHRLVAMAFIPNPESKPEVNHLNGKTDNRVCSLEWVTPSQNVSHAWQTGLCENSRESLSLRSTGENHYAYKITDQECELIKIKYATGNYSQRDLAEEFGVSQPQVGNIVRGQQRSRPTPSLTP